MVRLRLCTWSPHRNGEPSIDDWPSRVLYGKTDAVSRFQHYCLEQQQQQQQQQQSYQHGNITSTFFCTKAFGMARPLSRGLAILVVVGLKGAMVLCVNMPFWLPTFVTS